jgi:phage baseplate assembly protein V
MDGLKSGLWTSMPGIVQSFSADAVTATVQIAIKGVVHTPDDKAQFVNMPLLVDVPVHFPRGGGCTLTFPVAKGDECLVVFAARCIDTWWQSGGVQAPAEHRIHDLSDGFAFVGFFSQATKITGISTTSAQLRSNDGQAYIEINPASHAVNVVTSGNISAQASGTATLKAQSVTIDSPQTTCTGALTVQGAFTYESGMVGSGGSGASAQINGSIHATGDVTSGGISLDSHVHGDPQGGTTGGPQ